MLCILYICCIFEYRKELTTILKTKIMTTLNNKIEELVKNTNTELLIEKLIETLDNILDANR